MYLYLTKLMMNIKIVIIGAGEVGYNLAKTLMAVLVISFAATTLDTATRIQRFIISEIGCATKIHFSR